MNFGRLRRAFIAGAAAAATTGIASAVVTRTLMRAVALDLREPTSFSLAGSAGIAVVYTVALLPGCIALALTRRRWAWAVLAAGSALLLVEAVNIGYAETAAAHDLTAVRIIGLGLILTAMTAVYALQIYVAARRATAAHRAVGQSPRRRAHRRRVAVAAPVGARARRLSERDSKPAS